MCLNAKAGSRKTPSSFMESFRWSARRNFLNETPGWRIGQYEVRFLPVHEGGNIIRIGGIAAHECVPPYCPDVPIAPQTQLLQSGGKVIVIVLGSESSPSLKRSESSFSSKPVRIHQSPHPAKASISTRRSSSNPSGIHRHGLSAMMYAFFCASVRWSTKTQGTSVILSSFVASKRP